MFDIGWSELAVIAVVALVVIGPKDLPRALKTVGIWVRKARSISREFQGHVDQMIREAELEELRQQVEKVRNIDLDKEFGKTVDPTGSLAESLKPAELPDLKSELAAGCGWDEAGSKKSGMSGGFRLCANSPVGSTVF